MRSEGFGLAMRWWLWNRKEEKQQPVKVVAKKWIGVFRKSSKKLQTSKQKDQNADHVNLPKVASSVPQPVPVTIKSSDLLTSQQDGFRTPSSVSPPSSPDDFQASSSAFPPSSPVAPQAGGDAEHPDHYSVSTSAIKVCPDQPNEVNSGSFAGPFAAAGPSLQNSYTKYADTRSVDSSVEVLVRIPGSIVHLIDEEGSEVLASGEFLLAKIVQNGNAIAVFARVGENFQWPVAKDETTVKLDASHYFFSLQIPAQEKKEGKTVPEYEKLSRGFHRHPSASKESGKSILFPFQSSPRPTAETISYGVTFTVEDNEESLKSLDRLLDQYSFFSKPRVVQEVPIESDEKDTAQEAGSTEKEKEDKTLSEVSILAGSPEKLATPVLTEEDEKQQSEEISTEYWTTIAPNVQQYNSRLARAIATGSGHIIRGIFWCSDATIFSLERGGAFMKCRLRQNSRLTQISPRTMNNIKRAKKISGMSEKVAKAVLSGVVMSTEFFTSFMVKSKTSRRFVKLLPGEVALVSLDAYAKIFEAVEVAGNHVWKKSSLVTSGIVSHRYGPQAAEFTQEGLAAAGHVFGTVWTVSQIRNAFNPGSAAKGPVLVKSVAKAAGW
ncbi:hypothetical protein O6H91_03G010200 [Diphasiastrum complanatum]|uniref:Uncharacterized protein n=2 Tax=Diphasiastrum complanatum TaxID=34168 RepID=A0ACC2E3I2_DIPCM|nr:hypothetical protein O6H91_03G009400 [Diphasiastrum complanatum]KAJ7561007.1 hypothetical protein O6H91_03G010200 [Diphasiastrum complanatum]